MEKITPFKVARRHILAMIELALDSNGPCEREFKHYKIQAVPYRVTGRTGHSGVRVTWVAL
jgi:hypothetical protein